MVIHRIVQTVQYEQFLRVLREEVFVAHSFRDVFGSRCKVDGAVRQDLIILVESIDLVDALWIHQVRGVPSAGRVAHDVVRAVVDGQVFAIIREQGTIGTTRDGEPQSGRRAPFQKISPHAAVLLFKYVIVRALFVKEFLLTEQVGNHRSPAADCVVWVFVSRTFLALTFAEIIDNRFESLARCRFLQDAGE